MIFSRTNVSIVSPSSMRTRLLGDDRAAVEDLVGEVDGSVFIHPLVHLSVSRGGKKGKKKGLRTTGGKDHKIKQGKLRLLR
jgi:hypothetical protein